MVNFCVPKVLKDSGGRVVGVKRDVEEEAGLFGKLVFLKLFLFVVPKWLFDVSFGIVDCFFKNRLDSGSLVSLGQDGLKK